MKRRRNKEASNFATYSSALSTLWTSTRFFPFSVCYFFITFLLLWELWSKTWAFSISIILLKFFFSVRFSFLFDSLFIFLQFIEKVSVFTWNLWGKILVFHEFPWSFQSFHQAKPAPGRHLPRVENFSLFSFNFEKTKRMFLRLASQKNSLQVNVLIKAFCRYFSSWRLPLHRHSYYERWQVHKFRKRTFFIFLLRWKISQIVFFVFIEKSFAICKKSGTGIYREICIEIQYLTIKISGGIKSNIVALG